MIYIMILRRMVTCWEKKRPKGRYWTWSESSQGLSMAKGLLMAVRKNTRGGGSPLGLCKVLLLVFFQKPTIHLSILFQDHPLPFYLRISENVSRNRFNVSGSTLAWLMSDGI